MRNATIALTFAAVFAMFGCHRASQLHRTFATPDDAVRALIDAAKAGKMDDLRAIFGPDAGDLIASADPAIARQNREVFVAAAAERSQLVDQGESSKVLVVGNERWPFPVPLAKVADGWQFDTAAGKEEILDRRIGRNELAAIRLCHTYVAAQRLYASHGHDGRPAGGYATSFRSTPGKEDGLFWPAAHGQRRSPLGDLVAQAAVEGTPLGTTGQPAPFHGYYFRILTAQGADATGGAKDYVTNGHMTGGFALVAWPAQYDVTGITTFVVNQDGVVREKDLGPETDATVKSMPHYNPDSSWPTVQ
ncbi:MAG TPA: DUF2950 domain-containing protein [Vicinamibacterales bacterium]